MAVLTKTEILGFGSRQSAIAPKNHTKRYTTRNLVNTNIDTSNYTRPILYFIDPFDLRFFIIMPNPQVMM